jgi:hypothetical protein
MTSSDIVLMSAPKIAAIPVRECGEALVDVRDHGLRVDDRRSDTTGAFAYLCEGALTRLLHVQDLLPDGLRVLFVEGTGRRPSSAPTSSPTVTSSPAPIRTGQRRVCGRPPVASSRQRRSPRSRPAQRSTSPSSTSTAASWIWAAASTRTPKSPVAPATPVHPA